MATHEKRDRDIQNKEGTGDMTVREAGHLGGDATSRSHGHEFYSEIGHKGGQKVHDLIEKGKEAEGTDTETRNDRNR